MAHQPAWTDEELTLAIELLDRRGWYGGNAKTPEYIELSRLLRAANFPRVDVFDESFRSVNSISLKMGNLRGANDEVSGGLRAAERERAFVDKFLRNPQEMRAKARALRARVQHLVE
ncbi:hypothetical protein [Microbacterium soli]|uniref:Uncharacterized protein n=1 Tax=Microbacterium soli TaxID=446075 RepID=A0ABP7N295_9MICO